MTDEAKALVEREGMQVLLPPAAGVDGDYLMGWLEGQAYLISIYGTDEASDQAFTVAHQVHRMQNLIETQAREIERLGVIAGGNASIVCKILDEKDAEIERLREALEAYAVHCSICSGGGSIVEEDSATGALLWRDCPGCTPARAALEGDSHDQ